MKKYIGIDLGTTNSCASIYNSVGEMPQTVKVDDRVLVPSCIKLTNGELVVHYSNYNEKYKSSIAYSVKRALGIEDSILLTDEVTGEERQFSPKELSAAILKKIKKEVEIVIGEVDEVTITVPARFSMLQKQLTQEAGIEAGFKSVSIINEPTAAALAYKLEAGDADENILIFDLGGGTFDVSVLSIIPPLPNSGDGTTVEQSDASVPNFLQNFYNISEEVETSNKSIVKVISSNGDPQLGGDDIDIAILRKIYFDSNLLGLDLEQLRPIGSEGYKKMLLTVENYKKNNMGGTFKLQKEDGSAQEVNISLTQIEHGYRRIMRKAMDLTRTCVEQAGVKIDKIVLVGGSTKSPIVSKLLKEEFGSIQILSAFNPDEVVGLGASVSSAIRDGGDKSMEFIDVTPYTIGVKRASGSLLPIVLKDSVLPATGKTLLTAIEDGETCVHLFTTDTQDLVGSVKLPNLTKGDRVTVQLFVNKDSLLTCRAMVKGETFDVHIDLANLTKSSSGTDGDMRFRKKLSNYSSMNFDLLNSGIITDAVYTKNAELLEEYKEATDKDAFFLNKSKQFNKIKKAYSELITKQGDENKKVAASGDVDIKMDETNIPMSAVFR